MAYIISYRGSYRSLVGASISCRWGVHIVPWLAYIVRVGRPYRATHPYRAVARLYRAGGASLPHLPQAPNLLPRPASCSGDMSRCGGNHTNPTTQPPPTGSVPRTPTFLASNPIFTAEGPHTKSVKAQPSGMLPEDDLCTAVQERRESHVAVAVERQRLAYLLNGEVRGVARESDLRINCVSRR